MLSTDELNAMLERIIHQRQTDADIAWLRYWISHDQQTVSQSGKYAVNFDQGQNVYIGDRIYQGADAETIRMILDTVLREVPGLRRSRTETALLTYVQEEVNARLQQSLHHSILINLIKEQQVEQVDCAWDADIKIGAKPNEAISSATTILDVFHQKEIAGRLLILGSPGSGKTTTQLELAQALIEQAEWQPEAAIPVLFDLSTWKAMRSEAHPSILVWLIAELKSRYGVRVDLGRTWFEQGRLLPMLDGLDELDPVRQNPCVEAINRFLVENPLLKLVVCSRQKEYEQLETKLCLNGAVSLQPLALAQIQDYFDRVQLSEFASAVLADPALSETLNSPLLLSISVLAYQDISIEDWKQFDSSEDRLDYLFSLYLRQMLTRRIRSQFYDRKQEPSSEQTIQWLTWIAQQLKKNTQTEFLIERVQPACFTQSNQTWQYRLLLASIRIGVILGPIFGFIAISLQLRQSQIIILFSFLTIGMLLDWYGKITPIETLRICWKIPRKRFLIGLRNGLIFGLAGWLIGSGIPTPANNGGMIGAVIGGASAMIVGCIDGELIGRDLDIKTYPNQGMARSAKNGAIVAIILGLLFSSIGFIRGNPNHAVSLGLMGAVSGASVGGGLACVQHFTLRLVLWSYGSIPWNYARFLNYANERSFLQRVGGQYRFIHDLLREYFASGRAIAAWHSPTRSPQKPRAFDR